MLRKNKGLLQFAIRGGISAGIIVAMYLFVFLYFRHTSFFLQYLQIGEQFYFSWLSGLRKTDFMNAALFTLVIFIIWNREKLQKITAYDQNWQQTALFGVAAILVQLLHYVFKYWVGTNESTANQISFLVTLAKYLFNAGFIVLVVLAAYGFDFIKQQLILYKKQIPLFLTLLLVYFFLIQFFQMIWRVLGNFVAAALAFLLNLTHDNVYVNLNALQAPRLGVGTFIVGISEECSGIDSLLLFLSLYVVLFALDYKRMHVKRMLLLFIPGIIGTVLYNLFRVYLIMLVGIYISPEFAVDVFHTNVGWMLFLAFFMLFWHFGSKWVYKDKVVHDKK